MTTSIKPRIAVLMTAYNGMEWIEKQIQSILNQSQIDVSLFISIDLSTDGTYEWCKNLEGRYPQVDVLPYGEKYGGAAPNFFRMLRDVSFETFNAVAFADQDDIWFENKLSRALDQIHTREVDGYSSNVIAFWPSGKQQLIQKSQRQKQWDYLFEAAGPGCTYVFTKELALALQSFCKLHQEQLKPIMLHDWFSYAFARANNFKWYIDNNSSLYYRQHTGNQVGANNGLIAFIYRFKTISSGKGIRQSALLAKTLGIDNTAFVTSWLSLKRFNLLKLALYSRKCRRKFTEQCFFSFACILMAAVGVNEK